MANRFPGKSCVLCPNLSVGVGEHVWSGWFIDAFQGQGPFTASRAGVPYTKRDNVTPVTHGALQGVHVPMCESCNAMLNRTIEVPAKPIVRKLLAHDDSGASLGLSADECADLARWLLKVGILKGHPDADHDHVGLQRDPGLARLPVRPEWLDWMRTGSTPPDAFSVFATRRDLRAEAPGPSDRQIIVLPKLRVDGEDLEFTSWSFGFTGVNVTIVWHPGWPIAHPQLESGRAVRLWPEPVEIDFGALPQVHPKELTFWDDLPTSRWMTAEQFAKEAKQPLGVDANPWRVVFGEFAMEH